MNGWILLHKKIWESDNFKNCKNRTNMIIVWIWYLTHANEFGVATGGRKQIASDTGISESSVYRAINNLRRKMNNEATIEPNITHTKITILNWNKYQRKTNNNPNSNTNNNRTTSDQQTDTYKEINNKRTKEINTIIESYKSRIQATSILTAKAKSYLNQRFKTFSEAQLLEAIEKFSGNSWWMENNSVRGIAWFFQSDDRIDQFLSIKKSPPPSDAWAVADDGRIFMTKESLDQAINNNQYFVKEGKVWKI